MARSVFRYAAFFLFFCAVSSRAEAAESRSPIIEGAAGPGIMAFEQMFIDKSVAGVSGNFIPYGRVHLRFGDGRFLRPEIIAEDSGAFNFDISGIREGGGTSSYNSYYLKLPLGIPVPFFHYGSSLALDARYSVSVTGLRLKDRALVNNRIYESGGRFRAASSEMTFRLYLNTPVVPNPSFFEYSYFGVFYSERVLPRTAAPPGSGQGEPYILISTLTRTGGIFYDMKKDTPLKGLNFDISAYLGYGDMFKLEDISSIGASFGNTKELLTIYAKGGLSYRYIFGRNMGLDFNLGVSYFVTTEFLSTADDSKYAVNTGGDLRYFASLNFVFGY